MDPTGSIGQDEDRSSVVRSSRSMQPSSTTAAPPPPHRRHDQGDVGRRVSHLRTHESDDDDATSQSFISKSGERSVQIPRGGTGITPHDQGRDAPAERTDDIKVAEHSSTDVADLKSITQGARGTSPSREGNKKAAARLEMATSREPNEDLLVRSDVSGSNTVQVKSNQGAQTHSADYVQPESSVEGERTAQPGAYAVRGIHARDNVTTADPSWGDSYSSEQRNADEAGHEVHRENLLSAELVDPEAERSRRHHELQMQVHHEVQMQVRRERLAQQGSDKACCIVAGVDFSKRTNQVLCMLVIVLVVASALLAALFATGTVGPQSSAVATGPSGSSPPSAQPSMRLPQWVQVGNAIDGETPHDLWGVSVAMSSNGAVLAIGTIESNDDTGHMRVYVNNDGGWKQRGTDLVGSAQGGGFGLVSALSSDGTILATSAPRAPGINGSPSGQVYVYRWISDGWNQIGSTIFGEAERDLFGFSIALSDDGTVLAVGAWRSDADTGSVRVFVWTGTDWNQQGKLTGLSEGDRFGDSVALSSDGSILACGADQDGNNGPGYVFMYRWNGSEWLLYGGYESLSAGDRFGEAVSLSGDGKVLAIGADGGSNVFILRYDGTDWDQLGQTINGEEQGDRFGHSLSLSSDGSTVVIGGFLNNSNGPDSGHALVFRFSPNGQEWVQVGQELVGEAAGDRFGAPTSISDDGTRIAIGATRNDANGVVNAGRVVVYDFQ